jgi:solute carrier family 10 (sodium/bile acid cotransporter), member 7
MPTWRAARLPASCCSSHDWSVAIVVVGAGGSVPAAVFSASASSLLGVFLTPLIAGFLLSGRGADLSVRSLIGIIVQLLLPFGAGLLARPWLGAVIARKPLVLKSVGYGWILLIVYSAFSQGVVNGLWHQVDAALLIRLALVDASLLAAVITILTFASRRLGFSRADEITIVFCGSKKSLANEGHMSETRHGCLLGSEGRAKVAVPGSSYSRYCRLEI